MMLMTNMIHDVGDDHLTSSYDVASAQQHVSLLLPNGWKGFVDAEWMDRRPIKGSFFSLKNSLFSEPFLIVIVIVTTMAGLA